MTESKKLTFAAVMAAKTNARPTRTITMWMSSDLAQQYGALEEQRKEAEAVEAAQERRASDGKQSNRRLVSKSGAKAIGAEQQALIDAHPEAQYEFKLQAAKRSDWLELKANNPPTDGVDEDALGVSFNGATIPALRLCLVDPEPSDDVVAFLENTFTAGEWDRLFIAIWGLNEGTRDFPKSRPATSTRSGSAGG